MPNESDLIAVASTPDQAVGEAVVSRLSGTAAGNLEQFKGSPALASGQINLIALDAIVERMGARWQSRREQVYDMVERVLERKVGDAGFFIRATETEFLVATPAISAFASQAICLRAVGEILKHFLGAANQGDLRVRQVTDLNDREIIAVPVDPVQALSKGGREAQAFEDGGGSGGGGGEPETTMLTGKTELDPTLLSHERWSPFVAANGRRVRVSCVLEPVFELKNNTRIGYRLRRRVLDMETEEPLSVQELLNLSRADLLRIDMATIARGLTRLETDQKGDQELSLIIPVSYVTLSHHKGRTLLAQAFERARQSVMRGVLCEVCDIEDVPQVALLSAISLIKPWSLLIIGHLMDDPPRADPSLKDAGMTAVSFNCPANIGGDAEFLGWLREAMKSASRAARAIMVYGCSSPRRMAMAGLMGASHASVYRQ